MRKTDYNALKEKYDIDQEDKVCGNCEFHNMAISGNGGFSNFGMCEYETHHPDNIDLESEAVLTKPDRCCYMEEMFDEDAFSPNDRLLDEYALCEAHDETGRWLAANYYV